MRILYHHRTLGDGAEGIHVREMVKAFRALGHDVKVIGPVGEAADEPTAMSTRLAGMKRMIPSGLFECIEIGYSAFAFLTTTWEIWRYRPTFIYERYITFNVGTVLAGRVSRVPVLLEVNAPLALERSQQQDETLWFKRVASAMESWICRRAARTIVVSTPLKEYLESIGVPRDQCVVMPNGVDPERFVPRAKDFALAAQLGIGPDSVVVGFTGVLRAWHGLDLLLEAFALLRRDNLDVFLLIVGDGPARPAIETRIGEIGLSDRVKVTGRLPHDQVPTYVSLFDVAVSPKATFYASPMKVIEYMALGKPVVVPNTGNFLDMVDDRVNGVTFADGNEQALAACLASLYREPAQRTKLGAAARAKVETRLNWRWNALKACELLEATRAG
jgi:glycosyltransferase involved in cell wall biosynthesis